MESGPFERIFCGRSKTNLYYVINATNSDISNEK